MMEDRNPGKNLEVDGVKDIDVDKLSEEDSKKVLDALARKHGSSSFFIDLFWQMLFIDGRNNTKVLMCNGVGMTLWEDALASKKYNGALKTILAASLCLNDVVIKNDGGSFDVVVKGGSSFNDILMSTGMGEYFKVKLGFGC